jgi:hypothetical protein
MTPVNYRQYERSEAAVMDFPGTSSLSRMRTTMLNTRDALLIIGYELALRVLILARRWNY